VKASVTVGLTLVVTMTGVLLTGVEAQAQTAFPEAIGFAVQASADAVKVEVETGLFGDAFPGIPAGEPPINGSAAYTDAAYDDLGNNTGVASAPYPGSFAVAMPGLLRAVGRPGGQPGIGQAPSFPNWPFIVSSAYPGQEKNSQVNGPYGISATSGPHGSVADAKIGALEGASLLSPTSHSSATWDPASGDLIAQADSSFAALSLGPVLKLADVESHASLTAAPGADKPTMSSSFEVGTMTVAEVKVGLTDQGFVIGSSAQPRPDLGSLTPVLAAAGIEIEFLPSEITATSIRSAGLRISSMQEFPVQGPVKETLTLGRVSAHLQPGTAFTSFSAYGDDHRPSMPASAPAPAQQRAAAATQPKSPDCPAGWQRFGTECYPNVAIITPTLGFISFGATFGGPILCFMGTGALLSIGRGLGAQAVANEVGKQVTPHCTEGPNQFGEKVAQLGKELGPLTAINPVVNPALDGAANGFRSFATSMGPAIAPFGPAAYEMGTFVEFFKGS
jgi:hypothetical protein